MASDDTNQLYLAYAQQLKSLLPTGLGSSRLHIAPFSYGAIPLRSSTNVMYQNYSIFQLANSIPNDNEPILAHSGVGLVTAYQTYLGNIDLTVQGQLHDPDAVTKAQADVKDKEGQFSAALLAARVSFLTDCPNSIDAISGNATTLKDYIATYHPDVLTQQEATQLANKRYSELLGEQEQKGIIAEITNFRDAFARGQQQSDVQNFTIPVIISDPSTTKQVANNKTPTNSTASLYLPAFALGGTFDEDAQKWIDSFPPGYPGDRTVFDQQAKTLTYQYSDSQNKTWSDLGYSTSTKHSSSDGWIFWSKNDVSTNTDSHQNVNVDGSSIDGNITVKIWGHGAYDLNVGQWWTSNPAGTFKNLYTNADKSVTENILEKYEQALIGYGVEISFKLKADAFSSVHQTSTQTQSSSDSLSIFGSIYSSGNSSSTSNTKSFDSLQLDEHTNTVTLLASRDGVPIVLGALASRFSP